MVDLSEVDRTIARREQRLRVLADNYKLAAQSGKHDEAISIRHEMADLDRLVRRLKQERAMATPVDQRTDTNVYSRGAAFFGSN